MGLFQPIHWTYIAVKIISEYLKKAIRMLIYNFLYLSVCALRSYRCTETQYSIVRQSYSCFTNNFCWIKIANAILALIFVFPKFWKNRTDTFSACNQVHFCLIHIFMTGNVFDIFDNWIGNTLDASFIHAIYHLRLKWEYLLGRTKT